MSQPPSTESAAPQHAPDRAGAAATSQATEEAAVALAGSGPVSNDSTGPETSSTCQASIAWPFHYAKGSHLPERRCNAAAGRALLWWAGMQGVPSAPVGRQQVLPSPAVRDVVVPEPPVAGSMVVAQRPHHIAVVVHVHRVRLRYRGHCVHAVLECVVHIPAWAEPQFFLLSMIAGLVSKRMPLQTVDGACTPSVALLIQQFCRSECAYRGLHG